MTLVTSCPLRLTGCRIQQLGIISPRTASTLGRGRDSSNTDCIANTLSPPWSRQKEWVRGKKTSIKHAVATFWSAERQLFSDTDNQQLTRFLPHPLPLDHCCLCSLSFMWSRAEKHEEFLNTCSHVLHFVDEKLRAARLAVKLVVITRGSSVLSWFHATLIWQ